MDMSDMEQVPGPIAAPADAKNERKQFMDEFQAETQREPTAQVDDAVAKIIQGRLYSRA